MAVEFKHSETKDNLMRALPGKARRETAIPSVLLWRENRIRQQLRRYFYTQ